MHLIYLTLNQFMLIITNVLFQYTLWHNMRMFQSNLIQSGIQHVYLYFCEIIRALLNVEAKSSYEKSEISITITIKLYLGAQYGFLPHTYVSFERYRLLCYDGADSSAIVAGFDIIRLAVILHFLCPF